MINIEAVKDVVAAIENHRKAFDMFQWHRLNGSMALKFMGEIDGQEFIVTPENIEEGNTQCGTTLCIAGFAALRAGFKVKYITVGDSGGQWLDQIWINPDGVELIGDPSWVHEGAKALGLDSRTAARLFHYTTDNNVALAALKQLAEGVDPSNIYILMDDSDHCSCDLCEFEDWGFDEEDYYE